MNITNKNILLLPLFIILTLSVYAQVDPIYKKTTKLRSKQIGQSEWTITNLNLKKFRNGENILLVSNCQEWYEAGKMKRPACCYLDFDSTKSEIGLFYNWYAVDNPQKLAPKGWKVPSKKDLLTLVESLGGEEEAGKKLKSTSGWIRSQGENSSGLGFLPIGTILGANDSTDCSFLYNGEYTSFWSSTSVEFDYSSDHNLKAYGYFLTLSGWDGSAKIFSNPYKNKGCLVRLIKE